MEQINHAKPHDCQTAHWLITDIYHKLELSAYQTGRYRSIIIISTRLHSLFEFVNTSDELNEQVSTRGCMIDRSEGSKMLTIPRLGSIGSRLCPVNLWSIELPEPRPTYLSIDLWRWICVSIYDRDI